MCRIPQISLSESVVILRFPCILCKLEQRLLVRKPTVTNQLKIYEWTSTHLKKRCRSLKIPFYLEMCQITRGIFFVSLARRSTRLKAVSDPCLPLICNKHFSVSPHISLWSQRGQYSFLNGSRVSQHTYEDGRACLGLEINWSSLGVEH